MAQHRLPNDLENAHFPTTGKALYVLQNGGRMLAWGPTVPSAAATGYAVSCLFIHTDATTDNDRIYINCGTATSCDFQAVVPSGSTLALSIGALECADSAFAIDGQAAATATAAGGSVTVTGGAGGSTSGTGGAVGMVGGAGTAGNATGGAAALTAGAGQGTGTGGATAVAGGASGAGATGTGGAASVTAGASLATNGAGGVASVAGGAGKGTGAGGAASLAGGASGAGATGNGGASSTVGGAATSTNGNGGAASLTGGVATGTGTGGASAVTGGASAGASGTAGNASIDAGAATTGTAGTVSVGVTNAGTVNIGKSGSSVTVTPALKTGANIGAAAGTGVVATEYGDGAFHQTLLTFTNTPVVLADEAGVTAYGGLKVYDMPDGYIYMQSAVADIALTKSSAGVNDDWDGDFGVGTVTATNDATPLAATEQNIIPNTATPQAAAGVTTSDGVSTASEHVILDGHSTAIDVYCNYLVDDADHNVAGTPCNLIMNGTLRLTWIYMGDN